MIVNGTLLAEDGKKMSKKLKNYPEPPLEVVKKFGADAVRFALMSSPAVRGEDLRFSEKICGGDRAQCPAAALERIQFVCHIRQRRGLEEAQRFLACQKPNPKMRWISGSSPVRRNW